jgi:hypothetical protein
MKNYESNGKIFNVTHASALTYGYGHKKITVELTETTGETKTFSATTSYMPGYDAACDLEGQDKFDALYELISGQISDEVYEWLE